MNNPVQWSAKKHKGLYLHNEVFGNFIHAWSESDLQYFHKDWFTVQVQYAFDKTSSSMYWNGMHNIHMYRSTLKVDCL
jgi:hypothetical protein